MVKNGGTILQYGSYASTIKQDNIFIRYSGKRRTMKYKRLLHFQSRLFDTVTPKILACLTILKSFPCTEIASNECFCCLKSIVISFRFFVFNCSLFSLDHLWTKVASFCRSYQNPLCLQLPKHWYHRNGYVQLFSFLKHFSFC